MPQGKGTYGSKVGRPPKKKKYQSGGSIDPFSTRNPEGIPAKMDMEAIEEENNSPIPNALEGQNEFPTSNAMDRSEVSPMGAEVGTGVYKKGGKVKKSWKDMDVKMGPGPEESPTLREAMLHKGGVKKSEKIESSIKKHPKLFKGYKPFKEGKGKKKK